MAIGAKCPICRKATRQGEKYFPFCSERCQMTDFGKWSSEEYRIAGESAEQARGGNDEDCDR
ncbi:MAG: DNA gyrase inhibitor YacG [Bryobacter sp.]|nr:DNA gyrase inhibitor YacG [Bryobacter sp. CoA8 C33]